MSRRQGGFTLIELMIVVAIIGILAAIAIPQYQNYVARSQVASGLATLKGLQTPAELYIQENGQLATDLSDLGLDSTDYTGIITATSGTRENGVLEGAALTYTFQDGPYGTANDTMTLTRSGSGGWTCATSIDAGDPAVPDSCEGTTTTP
nr:pilin [Salinicola halimionae]